MQFAAVHSSLVFDYSKLLLVVVDACTHIPIPLQHTFLAVPVETSNFGKSWKYCWLHFEGCFAACLVELSSLFHSCYIWWAPDYNSLYLGQVVKFFCRCSIVILEVAKLYSTWEEHLFPFHATKKESKQRTRSCNPLRFDVLFYDFSRLSTKWSLLNFSTSARTV